MNTIRVIVLAALLDLLVVGLVLYLVLFGGY